MRGLKPVPPGVGSCHESLNGVYLHIPTHLYVDSADRGSTGKTVLGLVGALKQALGVDKTHNHPIGTGMPQNQLANLLSTSTYLRVECRVIPLRSYPQKGT